MPIFRVKSVKIYTGQKNFTRVFPWRLWQIWGMDGGDDDESDTCGVGGKVGGEQALQQK